MWTGRCLVWLRCLALGALLGLARVALADSVAPVTLLLSADQPPYQEVAEATAQRLAMAGRALQRATLAEGGAAWTPEHPAALTVAVGMRACRQAMTGAAPVFCTLVPEAGFRPLRERHPEHALTALFIDQPLPRFLRLIRAMLPEVSGVGVPLAATSTRVHQGLEVAAARQRIAVAVASIADERSAVRAIEGLIEHNEALLALFEPEVLTPRTAKWLLLLAYERQRPVIGYSRALVEAGAVAGLHTPLTALGEETAAAVLEVLAAAGQPLPEPGYPRAFAVLVNTAVARYLGLELPSPAALEARVRELEETSQ